MFKQFSSTNKIPNFVSEVIFVYEFLMSMLVYNFCFHIPELVTSEKTWLLKRPRHKNDCYDPQNV